AQALHLAAIHEILADEDRLEAVAFGAARLVGDDLDADAALGRIVEAGGCRPAGHIELAGTERWDHFGRGVEPDELYLETLVGEVALLVCNEERSVAGRSGRADRELLRMNPARPAGRRNKHRGCDDPHGMA